MTDSENTYDADGQPHPEEAAEGQYQATGADTQQAEERPVSFARWLGELVLMVALAFILAGAIRTWVVQPYVIPTGSMIPTIELQDRVIANKFIYRFTEPKRGDIVVLDDPTGSVDTLIKRVIAVGGETVDLVDGAVVVDGVVLDEPYTHGLPSQPMVQQMPYTVPEGYVWLMGDYRTNSADSRVFGAVPLSEVRGRAIFRFWPADRIGVMD
ncbi:MAG: signal peptidase I [Coriobacteriia bacterium]